MKDEPNPRKLELPARFERRFSVYLYWVSHGVLLLRSGKSDKDGTRIDILFQDVVWMALPAWWDTLEISLSSIEAIPFSLPATLKKEVPYRSVFRVATDGVDHFVVAGSAFMAEDDRYFAQDSLLLPDLHVKQT
jgi:hypothetical protein